MTFKEMIFNGLCDGTVKIITNPNDGYPACQIGEDWFYFIEDEYGESSPAELLTPDEIYKSYTKEELAEMIYFALQCKEKQAREEDIPELSDEVAYYKAFLEKRYADKEQENKTHMAEWHYMAKEPPERLFAELLCFTRPVQSGRADKRNMKPKSAIWFVYRVA